MEGYRPAQSARDVRNGLSLARPGYPRPRIETCAVPAAGCADTLGGHSSNAAVLKDLVGHQRDVLVGLRNWCDAVRAVDVV